MKQHSHKQARSGLPLPALAVSGGIGAGKSTVAGILREMGVKVYDTDAIYRALCDAPGPMHDALARLFGDDIITEEGVSRAQISRRLQADETLYNELLAITHPAIMAELARLMKSQGTGSEYSFCAVEVPLLFETDLYERFDWTLYITAPRALRYNRVKARPGMDSAKFNYITAHQAAPDEASALADFVVENSDDPAALSAELRKIISPLAKKAGSGIISVRKDIT